ncbi:hypothetical protein [Paenibacillus sp. sgz500992]|uniref:hypothetical protein n=1 Tax=Paenibacillus sp. sgz500992 TaxID=3242476 RepID=UPI0036D28818
MALYLENLDPITREYMIREIDYDLQKGKLYLSGRLTETGKTVYPELLKEYAQNGDDEDFARKLREYMAAKELAKKPRGVGYIEKDVPHTANETLAEGEFNTYYIRGLCARVIEEEEGQLEIYRAKEVFDPRPESQALLGQTVDAAKLLSTLRDPESKFKAIPKPNSGLSVRRK